MKSSAPCLKQFSALLFLVFLVNANISYGQRRAKAPHKSESRASGRRNTLEYGQKTKLR